MVLQLSVKDVDVMEVWLGGRPTVEEGEAEAQPCGYEIWSDEETYNTTSYPCVVYIIIAFIGTFTDLRKSLSSTLPG